MISTSEISTFLNKFPQLTICSHFAASITGFLFGYNLSCLNLISDFMKCWIYTQSSQFQKDIDNGVITELNNVSLTYSNYCHYADSPSSSYPQSYFLFYFLLEFLSHIPKVQFVLFLQVSLISLEALYIYLEFVFLSFLKRKITLKTYF